MWTRVTHSLAAGVLLLQTAPGPAAKRAEPGGAGEPRDRTAFHLVLLRLGPSWMKGRPSMEQPGIHEHARYISEHSKAGTIVLGGPFIEDPRTHTATGAMVVLATDDPQEARRLVEADPAVKSGLLEVREIHRLMVATGSWRPWKQDEP